MRCGEGIGASVDCLLHTLPGSLHRLLSAGNGLQVRLG